MAVKGEEGYVAAGRRGVVVGNRYESYEAWRVAVGVGTAIAVGTTLARPPRGSPKTGRSPTTTSIFSPNAVGLSLRTKNPPTPLAISSRQLMGFAFAFAVLWKAALSPDFLDGRGVIFYTEVPWADLMLDLMR